MKKILITGGTGVVGKAISKLLISEGYNVAILSRSMNITKKDSIQYYYWDISKEYIDVEAFKGTHTIIHLAGANIGKAKWSKKRKKEIFNSRINSTKLLLNYVKKYCKNLETFVSASAIGYYGTETSNKIFNETNDVGSDFLSYVCEYWEKEVLKFQTIGIKTVILRTGVVLSKKDGVLAKMVLPTKLGLNSPIGTGKQFVPWIHIDDLCRMYLFAFENNLKGI